MILFLFFLDEHTSNKLTSQKIATGAIHISRIRCCLTKNLPKLYKTIITRVDTNNPKYANNFDPHIFLIIVQVEGKRRKIITFNFLTKGLIRVFAEQNEALRQSHLTGLEP